MIQFMSCFTIVFALLTSTLQAQIGVTALVKTTFTDAKTGAPLSLKYELIPESGATKIRGSTPSDGTFEQILRPGETYKVICKKSDGIVFPFSFTLRPSSSYYEESQTLPVTFLRKGDALGEWMLFAKDKIDLLSEKELTSLVDLISANRGLSIIISVTVDPEVKLTGKTSKSSKKKSKPSKKFKKETTPTVDVVAERISIINGFFAQKVKPEALKRITVKADSPLSGVNVWATINDIKSMD